MFGVEAVTKYNAATIGDLQPFVDLLVMADKVSFFLVVICCCLFGLSEFWWWRLVVWCFTTSKPIDFK